MRARGIRTSAASETANNRPGGQLDPSAKPNRRYLRIPAKTGLAVKVIADCDGGPGGWKHNALDVRVLAQSR
jgi:hypothetical protein